MYICAETVIKLFSVLSVLCKNNSFVTQNNVSATLIKCLKISVHWMVLSGHSLVSTLQESAQQTVFLKFGNENPYSDSQ